MSLPLIALVEDEPMQRANAERALRTTAKITHYGSAEALLKDAMLPLYQLIVLDWGLPNMSGIEALKAIRVTNDVPILFLTSRSEEHDLVEALTLGADDFLSKPFRVHELQARVKVLIRRRALADEQREEQQRPLYAGAVYDYKNFTLALDGAAPVQLFGKELDLAMLLLKHIGEPLSREFFMRSVWGHGDDIPSRTLDTHISKVRTKLNLRPEAGWRLSPVYSFGYRLDKIDV